VTASAGLANFRNSDGAVRQPDSAFTRFERFVTFKNNVIVFAKTM
jgi:hypothetical protein